MVDLVSRQGWMDGIPLKGGGTWDIPLRKVREWLVAHPDKDVLGLLREAAQYLRDNERKRKTAGGMARFFGGWITRDFAVKRALSRGGDSIGDSIGEPKFYSELDDDEKVVCDFFISNKLPVPKFHRIKSIAAAPGEGGAAFDILMDMLVESPTVFDGSFDQFWRAYKPLADNMLEELRLIRKEQFRERVEREKREEQENCGWGPTVQVSEGES